MRKLLECDSLIQAELISAYLRSNGVETQVMNEYQAVNRGGSGWNRSLTPELWASAAQFEEAVKLVAQYRYEQKSSSGGTEWICRECRESNPNNFISCWNCGGQK